MVRTLPWGLVVVRGDSMRPTLRPGDRLAVRYGGRVRPGALVVVRLGAGATVAVKRASASDAEGWWVESDNPAAPGALDSWRLGHPVPYDAVLAVVVARVWPLRRPAPQGR